MRAEAEKLDALKLDTSAFRVVCYLAFKEDALKPSQIAERTGEKPSTVRARLTELKDAGLVRATPEGYVSTVNPYDILMKLYRDIGKQSSR